MSKVFQDRDEQIRCMEEASLALRKDRRTIMCAPTGAGKTYMSCRIAQRALQRGRRVWILGYRDEILFGEGQYLSTLMSLGISPSLICAGQKFVGGQQCYLGMIQTFQRRGLAKLVEKNDLVIADECHRGEFEDTINFIPSYCLGLSATPKASSGRHLKDYWGGCIAPISIAELISLGRLVPGITYSIDHDFGHLRIKGKDFDKNLLDEEFRKPKLFEGALEQYQRHLNGAKVIVYCVNVERSLALCTLFNDAGIRSCHVDGDTERGLRKKYFESFRADRITALFNVGIATTGYDEPSIEGVIENFATVQLQKHFQCVGRGGRAFGGQALRFGNKTLNRIIDMGRNYARHGKYGEEVDWIAIFNNPNLERKVKEKDRQKECRECGAVIELMLRACPYCGEQYTAKEVEEVFLEKADTHEIKEYKLQALPPHIRSKKVGAMNYEELKLYAKAMGHNPNWVNIQWHQRKKARARWGNRSNQG
jgi:superfamily II DNA or RNA helicase